MKHIVSSGGSDQVSSNSNGFLLLTSLRANATTKLLMVNLGVNRIGEMFANLLVGSEIVHEVIQSLDLRSWSEHFAVRGAWL